LPSREPRASSTMSSSDHDGLIICLNQSDSAVKNLLSGLVERLALVCLNQIIEHLDRANRTGEMIFQTKRADLSYELHRIHRASSFGNIALSGIVAPAIRGEELLWKGVYFFRV
jgi:hypothetical protein